MENVFDQKLEELDLMADQAKREMIAAENRDALEKIRVQFFGKKGRLTEILKLVGQLSSKEEKVKLGEAVNQVKTELQNELEKKNNRFNDEAIAAKLSAEAIDVTLPGRNRKTGSLHPVMQARDRMIDIFASVGFDVAEGPEIETEFYNFEALNMAELHPARAEQDTFYFANRFADHQRRLLRTHTSPGQIRYMQTHEPPIRLLSPGRVYRPDFDATHTPMFHQMEGLVVDRGIHFGHLKGIIVEFLRRFFEKELTVRFRASYFPFTEPSAEADMQCFLCQGKGCRLCGGGWIEVLGTGMVHPNVLKVSGVDPARYRGYAFGCGIDRFALLYYQLDDLRLFFENDLRFLQQF